VTNAKPVVTISQPMNNGTYAVGASITFTASFTDAGKNDTHTCSINWATARPAPWRSAKTLGSGSGRCGTNHIYKYNGKYTITVTITDKTAGSHRDGDRQPHRRLTAADDFVEYDLPQGGGPPSKAKSLRAKRRRRSKDEAGQD